MFGTISSTYSSLVGFARLLTIIFLNFRYDATGITMDLREDESLVGQVTFTSSDEGTETDILWGTYNKEDKLIHFRLLYKGIPTSYEGIWNGAKSSGKFWAGDSYEVYQDTFSVLLLNCLEFGIARPSPSNLFLSKHHFYCSELLGLAYSLIIPFPCIPFPCILFLYPIKNCALNRRGTFNHTVERLVLIDMSKEEYTAAAETRSQKIISQHSYESWVAAISDQAKFDTNRFVPIAHNYSKSAGEEKSSFSVHRNMVIDESWDQNICQGTFSLNGTETNETLYVYEATDIYMDFLKDFRIIGQVTFERYANVIHLVAAMILWSNFFVESAN
tara:strand:- start:263 stop:1255 length:993 start_codon:yes stop_codon:yes gene_type:complete